MPDYEMPDYDWREYANTAWNDRFPNWAISADLEEKSASQLNQWNRLLIDLTSLGEDPSLPKKITYPRLFISHKQDDYKLAKIIAGHARHAGFNYWLDVEDPNLAALSSIQNDKNMTAVIIACIIEMALLNCTHVIAVITSKTQFSSWVPYEFGRVKANRLVSLSAGSWLDSNVDKNKLPDYFHLAKINHDIPTLQQWLKDEKSNWTGRHNP